MTLYAKIAMSDLQRYPRNINLIKTVEDIVGFLTRNVFITVNFSIVSYRQKVSCSETTNENKVFDLCSIRQSFKGTVVNCHLCIEGHLKLCF